MRRTYPASQSLTRAMDQQLAALLKHHRRTKVVGRFYPFESVGVLYGLLIAIESTTFNRRELQTWFRRFKRWRKHPVVSRGPSSYKLADLFGQVDDILHQRYRHLP